MALNLCHETSAGRRLFYRKGAGVKIIMMEYEYIRISITILPELFYLLHTRVLIAVDTSMQCDVATLSGVS